MPVRTVWSNVDVDIQSALSAAQNVTAISKANPGVVSYAGTDPANGDFVLITNVQGMREVNNRVFRVAGVDTVANTFQIEGEDTTNFGTFAGTGTVQVITFGTSLEIVRSVTASGGEPREIDFTTIHDDEEIIEFGVLSRSQFSMEAIWDPSDPGLVALKSASQVKADRAVRFTFANGFKHVFVGKISAGGDPTGQAQEAVLTSVSITRQGRATFYAA